MYVILLTILLALLSPAMSARHMRHRTRPYKVYNNDIDEGIAKFGVNLNKMFVNSYYEGGENILFSPMSIYYSLALAHLGAAGTTRDELAQALNIHATDDEMVYKWHQTFGGLIKHLHQGSYANVSLYNQLFVQNGYHVRNQYEDWISKYYNTKVSQVDFSSKDATDYVNKWFSTVTGGRIPHYYEEKLSEDVKVLLANALSYGGSWDREFPSRNTRRDYFRGEDGNEEQVPMMNKVDSVLYYNDVEGHYETVGIPYKNREYYLYLIMPYENENMRHFTDVFSYSYIQNIIGRSFSTMVDIKLPAMKLKTTHQVKDALVGLGISHLFEEADMSNLLQESQLKVSDVWHYVDLEMNEYGTDICAGTTQEYKMLSPPRVYASDAKRFWVQKPFMFFIYHPGTKIVLFYGSVSQITGY